MISDASIHGPNMADDGMYWRYRSENASTGLAGLLVPAGGKTIGTVVEFAPAALMSGKLGMDGAPEEKAKETDRQTDRQMERDAERGHE